MNQIKKKFLIACMILLCTKISTAQNVVSGTVKSENGETLIGVSVTVKGTALGSITDVNGQYTVNVPSFPAKLVFSFVGYTSLEKEVTASSGSFDLVMKEKVSQISEVVISGLATNIKRSNAANAVSSISARELTGITSQGTLDGALYGKLAGASISANGGSPGGGISVKLRGITSIIGNSQPLYIVDGVYYDNSAIPAGLNVVSKAANQGSASNQDNPSNRIADLSPDEIESIEVLKGASAAAIYGARAAGGVVIITTKRGRIGTGAPQVAIEQSVGMQTQLRKLGQRSWDPDKALSAYGQSGLDIYNANGGKTYDYEKELYGNKGIMNSTRIGVSGGNNKTAYYAGFSRNNEEGIIKRTGYEKSSFRLNLDQQVFSFMDLGVSTNYVLSSADRGYFGNDNTSTTMGISFVSTPSWENLFPDSKGNYPDNHFAPSNFLQTRDLITNNEKVNRALAGATLKTRFISDEKQSLQLILRGGIDYYTLNTEAIFPTTLQFEKDGNGTSGLIAYGNTTNKGANLSAFLVHSYYFPDELNLRTQVGVTQEMLDQNSVLNTATFLIGSQNNIDQAGSLQAEHNRIQQRDKGFFVQEEVNFREMIIATVGIRGDKSSRNGDSDKLYYFPKASLAANLSKFGFWNSEGNWNSLKLRAAYGQSGNFAPYGAIYNPLVPAVFNGTTGSLIGLTRGNATIEPERQKELEGGFDIGFANPEVSFDFTYYKKDVDDLILNVEVPSSTGFNTQLKNVAAISNKGFEIGLDITPVRNQDFTWNARLAWWKNKAEVTRLDVPAFNLGAFGATLGTYRIEKGKSPTQIIGIGDDKDDPDGDGLVVWGDAEPDFQMSWFNTLKYKNWELSFLFHWKKGGDNINLSTLLSDIFGTSPDYDEITLDPEGKLSNGEYRLSQLGVSAKVFVEDASYIRMREASLFYAIPRSVFNNKASLRMGISARNLINIFDYNSYDPEVSNFGVNAISSNVEVTPYPSAKSVHLHVGLLF